MFTHKSGAIGVGSAAGGGASAGALVWTSPVHIQIGLDFSHLQAAVTTFSGMPLSSKKMISPPQTPPERSSGKTPSQEVPF